jgi:pilus assembly protein CpaE
VIHAIPAGGGCGCTTIACNVAASLARSGAKAVILDLDLVRGGVADAFNLRPPYSIADLMDMTSKLDRALLDNALAVHKPTGLSVLARPATPEEARRVTREGLLRLLSLVVRSFDYVVIDSVMSADPVYEVPLRAADINVLVMQMNVPCAKSVERFAAALRRMGVAPDHVRVVANRHARKGGDLDPAEVEKALGFKIAWAVPNDFKNAVASINLGEPVVVRAPRAELSESLQGLSHLLNGRTPARAAS